MKFLNTDVHAPVDRTACWCAGFTDRLTQSKGEQTARFDYKWLRKTFDIYELMEIYVVLQW